MLIDNGSDVQKVEQDIYKIIGGGDKYFKVNE